MRYYVDYHTHIMCLAEISYVRVKFTARHLCCKCTAINCTLKLAFFSLFLSQSFNNIKTVLLIGIKIC